MPSFVSLDWVHELVSSLQFHSRAACGFQHVAHISIQETRAGSIADRIIAQETPHSRTLTVRDSRVLVGCRVKGRSSSAALNHQLLKTLPDLLGSDMYTGEPHVNSEFNPADDPSRRVAVRKPIGSRSPRVLGGWMTCSTPHTRVSGSSSGRIVSVGRTTFGPAF